MCYVSVNDHFIKAESFSVLVSYKDMNDYRFWVVVNSAVIINWDYEKIILETAQETFDVSGKMEKPVNNWIKILFPNEDL